MWHLVPHTKTVTGIMYQDSVVIPRKAIIMIQESSQESIAVACNNVCIMYRYLRCIVSGVCVMSDINVMSYNIVMCQVSVSCHVSILVTSINNQDQ